MPETAILKKIPFLSELPEGDIFKLARSLKVFEFEQGELIFCENEPGNSLYIVLEGGVDVLMATGTVDEKVIACLGPGEFIGEMSLMLPGGVRTAGARANRKSRMWEMTRGDFDTLLARQPSLAYAMVRTMAKRLDDTNTATFRDLREKNRQLQKAYDELKAAQEQIIEKERLEHELQVAADIQTSILPQELPQVGGFDFGALMVPARMVGGDFYDIFLLDGDRIGFLIGDVADKGIPSAIFMARTHALIMSEAMHNSSPADVLQQVNRHLIRLDQSSQFVTVILGILETRSGEITYARAGHEIPILLDPTGEVKSLPHLHGQAIGLLDELTVDEYSFVLEKGATLVLFTDGMTDCRDPKGEPFGYDGLCKYLEVQKDLTGQTACDALWSSLQLYQSGAAQDDDVTLVAVHRCP